MASEEHDNIREMSIYEVQRRQRHRASRLPDSDTRPFLNRPRWYQGWVLVRFAKCGSGGCKALRLALPVGAAQFGQRYYL